jgi:6-phosphogluconolactonase (cycloisomerase 2 family)
MRRTWTGNLALLAVTGVLLAPVMASAKRTFVYVHDRRAGGGIWGFEMDKDGELTSLGLPTPHADALATCTGNCQTMAYSTKRKMLYAGGDTGVSGWTVNKDGSLTSLGGPFVPSGGGDFVGTGVMQVGKRVFVYANSHADNSVYGFEAQQDGQLSQLVGTPVPVDDGPIGLAVRKKFVFVANEAGGSISSFLASKDGTLTDAPGSPVTPNLLLHIFNVDPDPKGKFLYVADDVGGVHSFRVDKKTAALDEHPDSPFATQFAGFKNGAVVTKKFLWAIDANVTDDAMQPFYTSKDGSLEITGIAINTPLVILAYTADAKAKRLVLAGPASVVVATLEKGETNGSLEGIGSGTFSEFVNANAVVMVKR